MTQSCPCSVPVLHTARLKLVAPEARHFPAFAEMHGDPVTMRHIGDGQPLDRVSAWLHLAMLVGHWHLRGYGVWMLEEPGRERMIGRAGLFRPDGWDEPELSWMIAGPLRGRGLATEAAAAAQEYAFGVLGFTSVISMVRPENLPSRRVAEKLGGTLDETIDFFGLPMQVFRYRRRE